MEAKLKNRKKGPTTRSKAAAEIQKENNLLGKGIGGTKLGANEEADEDEDGVKKPLMGAGIGGEGEEPAEPTGDGSEVEAVRGRPGDTAWPGADEGHAGPAKAAAAPVRPAARGSQGPGAIGTDRRPGGWRRRREDPAVGQEQVRGEQERAQCEARLEASELDHRQYQVSSGGATRLRRKVRGAPLPRHPASGLRSLSASHYPAASPSGTPLE